MTAYVYQGATAPEAVELVVAPSAALPDLSVVTAATITAERADGAVRDDPALATRPRAA